MRLDRLRGPRVRLGILLGSFVVLFAVGEITGSERAFFVVFVVGIVVNLILALGASRHT